MATYFIGDIQGCYDELQALMAKVEFNPSKDEIWIVGDMVARGEKSLETLRYIKSLEGAAKPVLGNHELHLLALHGKIKSPNPDDRLTELLQADDIDQLIDWIREQPLIRELATPALLMTHAGIPPQWDAPTAIQEADAVHRALNRPDYLNQLVAKMYRNDINHWSSTMNFDDRLIYCINALTRMRYLDNNERLDFSCKLAPQDTPQGLTPWFNHPNLANYSHTLVFGHWAALMGKVNHDKIKALDTGCCWGQYLTLWHLESNQKVIQHKLKK